MNKLPVLASTAEAPLEPDAEAAEPVAEAVPVPEPEVAASEPVVVADAVAGVLLAVTTGPGPWVIIWPLPPGNVAPAAAEKSCGTPVWLLAKKYWAAAGTWPRFDSSRNVVRLNIVRFVSLKPSNEAGKVKLSCCSKA